MMQTGKKAVETVKETAANVAASANAGMDKTKATVQEKVDRMRAKDDFEKGLATEVKDQRITAAELHKQQAQTHNLDLKEARTGTGIGNPTATHSATGVPGVGTGAHQMSALPGHGTGQPAGGHLVEGAAGAAPVQSHPIGKTIGTNTTTDTGFTGTGGGYRA